MKLQSLNYTRQQNVNTEHANSKKKNPSFGNPAVAFATFIENNGFLGEFLSIDTFGMMAPRTGQGYLRNRKELGHLNYKAGREELVREVLSGPAFFYVPLLVMTGIGLLRGKVAKVQAGVLDSFKPIMQKTTASLKDSAAIKKNFVKTLTDEAFQGYDKEKGLISELSDLMVKNVEKTEPAKKLRAQAVKVITKLNKANGKYLDNASTIQAGGKDHDVNSLFKDMRNYLDDFTKKAEKTSDDKETFVNKFHKRAKELRYATNILAVGALSAFLCIIPKLYQTGDKFPGVDGLNTGENTNAGNTTTAKTPDKVEVKGSA